jgi:hypothetical protein
MVIAPLFVLQNEGGGRLGNEELFFPFPNIFPNGVY